MVSRRRSDAWHKKVIAIHSEFSQWRFASQRTDPETWGLFLAHFRLEAVVHAPSAIEYHARKIETLSRGLKHADLKRMGSSGVVLLTREMAMRAARAGTRIEAIDVEWHDLVWWGRTLLGRLQHEFRSRGARHDIGLLAYVLPREARDVRAALRHFSSRWATDLTAFANYSLHCESISRSQPRMRFTSDGVQYPIPDRITTSQLDPYTNFNYEAKRDAVLFSRELFTDVTALVDSILYVFARGQAERWAEGK